jgi:hypothetical protein
LRLEPWLHLNCLKKRNGKAGQGRNQGSWRRRAEKQLDSSGQQIQQDRCRKNRSCWRKGRGDLVWRCSKLFPRPWKVKEIRGKDNLHITDAGCFQDRIKHTGSWNQQRLIWHRCLQATAWVCLNCSICSQADHSTTSRYSHSASRHTSRQRSYSSC